MIVFIYLAVGVALALVTPALLRAYLHVDVFQDRVGWYVAAVVLTVAWPYFVF